MNLTVNARWVGDWINGRKCTAGSQYTIEADSGGRNNPVAPGFFITGMLARPWWTSHLGRNWISSQKMETNWQEWCEGISWVIWMRRHWAGSEQRSSRTASVKHTWACFLGNRKTKVSMELSEQSPLSEMWSLSGYQQKVDIKQPNFQDFRNQYFLVKEKPSITPKGVNK